MSTLLCCRHPSFLMHHLKNVQKTYVNINTASVPCSKHVISHGIFHDCCCCTVCRRLLVNENRKRKSVSRISAGRMQVRISKWNQTSAHWESQLFRLVYRLNHGTTAAAGHSGPVPAGFLAHILLIKTDQSETLGGTPRSRRDLEETATRREIQL